MGAPIEAPKRRGRPPLPAGAGRTARIDVLIRPAVRAKAEADAAAAGMSLAAWVERCLDKARSP